MNNRKKDILILRKGLTQGLEHTLSAEKINSIKFTKQIQCFICVFITMEPIVTRF